MNELKARVLDESISPFERLCRLMAILRSPEGCQWDRAQTHKTLLPYLIEEAYEFVEAVEADDDSGLKEELGDLLCQVVFHAQLAAERDAFRIDDSIQSIVDKLLHRHPHIFENRADLAPGEVRDQWEKIKTESGEKKTVLGGIPTGMPALTMGFRIGEKAGGVGFDWPDAHAALDKVREEISEVESELTRSHGKKSEELETEIGDLLFAVVSVARLSGVEPETALRKALHKFRDRFARLEKRVNDERGRFGEYKLDELEIIWQQIKL